MALFQSSMAKRRETPPTAYVHGARMVSISKFTFTAAFAFATDKIEMGLLPAGARVVGARLIGRNLGGANNASLGLMSGEAGEPDNARTVGTQLFSAQAAQNAEPTATTLACLSIAPSDGHRGIGVTLSADVAAGDRDLTLVLEYIF
ncbi:hypothetical protein [Pararhodobacter sp.]|uniref:hypothetical protein n=1 Tax=Pararhodobacter sp. TaxID=2127056 RepID=UPI002FDD4E27